MHFKTKPNLFCSPWRGFAPQKIKQDKGHNFNINLKNITKSTKLDLIEIKT